MSGLQGRTVRLFIGMGVLSPPALGDLLVGDWNNHQILRFTDDGHLLGVFGEASDVSGLGIPGGIAVSASGEVFVKSLTHGDIFRFAPSGDFLGIIDDFGAGFQQGLHFDSEGHLWFRRFGLSNGIDGSRMVEVDTQAGTVTREFNSMLEGGRNFAFDAADIIYLTHDRRLAGDENDGIYRFTRDGVALGPFGMATFNGSGVRDPNGVAFDSVGRLYVCSGGRLRRYDANGSFLDVFAQGDIAGYMVIDSLDNVYITEGSEDAVVKFDPDGNMLGYIVQAGVGGVPANFRSEGVAYFTPIPEPPIVFVGIGAMLMARRGTRRG
jgi:sugar lactone lactonase YvrE